MLVTFYNFTKRENSTKLPTDEDITISGEVSFKRATSLVNPILIMAVGNSDETLAMNSNYCKIGLKYYYITDVVLLNSNHMEFTCKIDVLASYKENILKCDAYVMYSSSHYSTDMVDGRVISQCNSTANTSFIDMSNLFRSNGIYILETVSGKSFCTPYLLSHTELAALTNEMVTPDFLTNLKQYFDNPMDTVLRLQISAYNFAQDTAIGGVQESIRVGAETMNSSGVRFDANYVCEKFYEVPIPWNYNDYRSRSPYSKVTLFLPFVGMVTLDTASIYNSKSLSINVYLEVATGNLVYMIYADNPIDSNVAVLVETYSGNCNSDVPIARVVDTDPIKTGMNIAMVGGSTLAGYGLFGASAIPNAIDGFRQTAQVNGAHSSFIDSKLPLKMSITVWSTQLSEEPLNGIAVKGLPCFRTLKLSSLSGYCMTSNFNVECNATLEENIMINNYLNGGVYIE